jgi:hypothetical protein
MRSQHNPGEFLDHAENIGSLMPKARHLLELRRAVLQLLPESLSRSCTVANDRQGRLVIFAESSAIAAKLKLLAPALRNRLLEIGQQITSVVIEVQPPPPRANAQLHKPVLTPAAAAALSDLCDRMTDPALKEVLRTLASRAGPRS